MEVIMVILCMCSMAVFLWTCRNKYQPTVVQFKDGWYGVRVGRTLFLDPWYRKTNLNNAAKWTDIAVARDLLNEYKKRQYDSRNPDIGTPVPDEK